MCDLRYGDKKIEYLTGHINGIADNIGGMVPAENLLIFLTQSVAGRFRMVLSYYFVKNLVLGSRYLTENLLQLWLKQDYALLRGVQTMELENMGCRRALGIEENKLPWTFPDPQLRTRT